ncbi:MAG TPA: energy transducer TonB [Stellaceae bacterium]|nr:energy transducer TonB [Stellaceae bacterium]
MPTIVLSAVPELHGNPPTMKTGLRRLAVLAAIALHLAVFLWLFHPWRSAADKPPPASLPVTLVFEPPPEPKPEPKPQPKPQPAPAQQKAPPQGWDRASGPEAQTTAPPSEPDEVKKEEKPEAAAPAPAPPAEDVAPPPPPAPAVITEPPTPPKPRPEPPRPAAQPKDEKPLPHPQSNTATALHPRTSPDRVRPGERRMAGDPYLNAISRELDKHRFYPDLARPLGLRGVARFVVVVDRRGKLIAMQLIQSSGSELLDRAAEKAIRDTLPFPPVPADYPDDPVEITMEIPNGPN